MSVITVLSISVLVTMVACCLCGRCIEGRREQGPMIFRIQQEAAENTPSEA